MQNVCGWIAQAGTLAAHSRLSGVERADWLVVGAGITGLSAAHTLAQLHPQ
ncbi:FAD-dependent oxidoreductase, partial [Pseudomonas sp. MAFF212427]|nr:FAD-dependent oxidoreductase [Pseudomonas brassicae]